MKKLVYTLLSAGLLLAGTTSCEDYLDASSASVVDPDLVFSDASTTRRALLGAYADWNERNNKTHSLGLFYDYVVTGSDIERHAESTAAYIDNARTAPEVLFPDIQNFSIDFSDASDCWTYMYRIIATCNNVINSVEATDEYATFAELTSPTDMSQIYGEAVALRATAYFELLRHFGDVPHKLSATDESNGVTPRDAIYEYHLNKLIEVEPIMYRVGEGNTTAASMNRTYVQGLIGRYCLYAAGYSTRRTDLGADFYKDLEGNPISLENYGPENNGAVYARRSDYKKFYETAKTYLAACVQNPGSVQLIVNDDRSAGQNGQQFGNPFQRKFQYMNDLQISPESVYEITYEQGKAGSERPYSYGRGSNGGSKDAYPCKTFGQSRFYPTYYYGDFDPKDLRRDVTVTVTGSDGSGYEVLTKFTLSSKGTDGGLCNNKWDENRMSSPYTAAQRQSGISCLYMSFDDIILMLAEVYAELGDAGAAQTELAKVRNRAFASTADADVAGFIAKCGGIKEAILEERKLEFGGEGMRRWDLIRTGKLPEAAVQVRKDMTEIINKLEAQGYYEFENGNQLPLYIWTKSVDAKTEYGYRLTTQCPAMMENDPVLYPSWRGQHDDWARFGCVYPDNPTTNLAIVGLFRYIDPESAEAKQLEADGYTRQDWGKTLLSTGTQETDNVRKEYTEYPFCGYTDADFSAKNPPLYLMPFSSTALEQDPSLTNGYGFSN